MIAVLIWEDRHTDTTIELYADSQVAIARAEAIISKERQSEPPEFWVEIDNDYPFSEAMKNAGWLYYKVYSTEGDHVHVEMKELR
jgi:hypothetical protein